MEKQHFSSSGTHITYKESTNFKGLQNVQKKLETGATSTTAQNGAWKLLPTISFVPLQEEFKYLSTIGI